MEIAALIASFVSPFLPHLMNLGKPVAEGAGKKLGEKFSEGAWEKAKQLWGKIGPKIEEKPLAKGAAEELAENADDADALEVLTKQVKKILEANPDLAQSLRSLLDEDAETVSKVVKITQTVTGDRNVTIGDAGGSVNITQS